MTSITREDYQNTESYTVSVDIYGVPMSRKTNDRGQIHDFVKDFQIRFPGVTVKVVEIFTHFIHPDD